MKDRAIEKWLADQGQGTHPAHHTDSANMNYTPPSPDSPEPASNAHREQDRDRIHRPHHHSSDRAPSPGSRYRPVTPPVQEEPRRRRDATEGHKVYDAPSRPSQRGRESRSPYAEQHRSHQARDSSKDAKPRKPRAGATTSHQPRVSSNLAPTRDREVHRSRRGSISSSPHRRRRVEPSIHHHEDHSTPGEKEDHHHRHREERPTRSVQSVPRPPLTRSKTTAGHARRPLSSYLDDPRISHAAQVAFKAGATAAVGLAGSQGSWSKERGAKIATAALGAAALDAFQGGKAAPTSAAAHSRAEAAPKTRSGGAEANPLGEALGSFVMAQLAKRAEKARASARH